MGKLDPKLENLFAQALEIADAKEREAFVERACDGDEALRQELESLLRADQGAGDFMKATQVVGPANLIPSEKTGDRIGRYKLLEQIGEGGFGVVWMAEQEDPVRRRVALKIIKLGMDTKEVVARFEAERQALALMEHPNIASVFDGGATDTGRPYFVMELVKGIPITAYCDANKLPTTARLALFIQVCHAVQHAHQNGIIHRDLKPSNILVTEQDGSPVPKVIDFGVAKATQARLTEKTLFTRLHQMIGTPAYMSPEQAGLGALGLDTRSDIYALGVLLYELLTGRTPFTKAEFEKASLDEIFRLIREQDPPKPSTRLPAPTANRLIVDVSLLFRMGSEERTEQRTDVLLQTNEVVTVGPLKVKFLVGAPARNPFAPTNPPAAQTQVRHWLAAFLPQGDIGVASVTFFSAKSNEPILGAKNITPEGVASSYHPGFTAQRPKSRDSGDPFANCVWYGFAPPEDRMLTIKLRYYDAKSLVEKHCIISTGLSP